MDDMPKVAMESFLGNRECTIPTDMGDFAIRLNDADAKLSLQVVLAAGQWALHLTHRKGPDVGVYVLWMDGERVAMLEGYHPTVMADVGTLTFTTPEKGNKLLEITVDETPAGRVGVIQKSVLTRLE